MASRACHLRFGPYRPPRFHLGQQVECLARGAVRIVAISDAPVQWPLGALQGGKSPVLYGSLVKAVKSEAAIELREAFGVGNQTVGKWRRALGVKRTKGDRLRQSEAIRATDPARARKIAKAKLGQPRPRHVIEAMAAARRGKRLSKATRAKMSATHRRLGTRPPDGAKLWTAHEDQIVRKNSPADAVRLTGRTLKAVTARRGRLGVKDGRAQRHKGY